MKTIKTFDDEFFFLSNFYQSKFYYDGQMWKTVEHFYQAHKATNMGDLMTVANAETPSKAKKLGREIKCRDDWEEIKDKIMFTGLQYKFNCHTDLRDKLVDTSPMILIEGNKWHDNYWGVCSCEQCKDKEKLNKLGEMLMRIRDMHNNFLNI